MTHRKKLFLVALILNFLFYGGVAAFYYLYEYKLQESQLTHDLSKVVNFSKVHMIEDEAKLIRLAKAHQAKPFTAETLRAVSSLFDITNFIVNPDVNGGVDLLGLSPPPPIPSSLLDRKLNNFSVFFLRQSKPYISHFIQKSDELRDSYLITVQRPLMDLKETRLEFMPITTVIEQDRVGAKQLLYSDHVEEVQQHLKENFTFQETGVHQPYSDYVFHEKLLIFPHYLVNKGPLRQAILYTFKISDFKLISQTNVILILLAFACATTGFTYLAYIKTREEN